MTDHAEAPIFVVGCQRSGTTLLRLMLDSHVNISCGPETRFLAELARLTGSEWDRLRLFGFPKEYWHAKAAEFFGSIHRDYARARGKRRWADKTPRYALSLEYIDELFPTSQIVHVIRDGRDVVASHRRFGYLAAVKAVEKWPRYIVAAREVGSRLPEDRYHELRYERLVMDTEPVMRELLDFLGEPWDDAVLNHEQFGHDVAARYDDFTSVRREAAGDPGAVYRSRVGAHRRENDLLLRLMFRARASRMLRNLGYR